MKLTKRQLSRIIQKVIAETVDIEPQSPEEKIAQLMSDPVGDPETWLQGWELGLATGVIEEIITDPLFVGQYRVKPPKSIAAPMYDASYTIDNRRDFGHDHPFRIILGRGYFTVIIPSEQDPNKKVQLR